MALPGGSADAALIESVSVPVAVLDAELNFVSVNRAFEREFDYSRTEITGQHLLDLVDPNQQAHFSKRMALLEIQEAPTSVERVRICARLGRMVGVTLHLVGVQQEHERSYTATFADIEHPYDGVPFSSTEIYRLAIEESPLAMSIQDKNYRIIAINKAYTDLTGFSAEELIGKDPAQILHPPEVRQGLPSQRANLTDACRTDDNIVLVREMTARGGRRLRYRVAFRRSEDRYGEPIFVAILMDMGALENTRSKRDEFLALSREAIARFDTFASLSTDAIVVFDAQSGIISQANQATEAIFGLAPDSLLGQRRSRLLQHVAAADRRQVADLLDHVLEEPQPESIVRIDPPAGHSLSVRLRIVETGQIRERFLLAEDVTSRLERDAQQRRAEARQRDALIHEVHHRIKNGLHSVAAMLEHARDTGLPVRGSLTSAMNRVQAIAQVHGLLIDNPQLVPVEQMCEVVLASIEAAYGVPIEAEYISKCDKTWLVTERESVPVALVLNELSTNAVKYRQGESAVSVRVTSLPGCVQIEIINTGRLSASGTPPTERRSAGLELVHALLPGSHAELSLGQQGSDVVAQLTLSPPIIKADNQELSAAA